jgi:hypothetical protein
VEPLKEDDIFERGCKVMAMFIDNAKSYVQLSAGALLLTITFLHEILGIPKETKAPTDCWLVIAAFWGQSFLGHSISISQQNIWSGDQAFQGVTTAGHSS